MEDSGAVGVGIAEPTDNNTLQVPTELELVENSIVDNDSRLAGAAAVVADSDQDTVSSVVMEPNLVVLPEVIVQEILKQSSDQQSLLNSRLVCTQWNEVIQNTSELMRKITFTISNLQEFLNLEIVKEGKVKSIRFKTASLKLESESIKNEFLQAISAVEKVSFEFEKDPRVNTILSKDAELCNLVLKNGNRLQELIFNCYSDNAFLPKSSSMFGYLLVAEFPSTNKAKKVSVNVEGFKDGPATDLVKFLLKLAKLEEINLYGTCWTSDSYATILHGLCEYIKTYQANLCLKKLALDIGKGQTGTANDEAFVRLLILAGKFGISFVHVPTIELNSVLQLSDSQGDLPWGSPLFPSKINGKLTFEASAPLSNLERLRGLNFGDLHLIFNRPDIYQAQLSIWMHHVRNLDCLLLQNRMTTQRLIQNSLTELEAAFLNETFTLLKALKLHNDLFDNFGTLPLQRNFPNLKELSFESCDITPVEFISELSGLDCLEKLYLTDMPNLTDAALTKECVDRSSSNGSALDQPLAVVAPAIACFKSLTELKLIHCSKLTEACLINGVAHSKTLRVLDVRGIHGCRNVTLENIKENMAGRCKVDSSTNV